MLATGRLEHLLTAVAAQDRAAFKELYDTTAPKLFATVLRILRNRAAAEEALQDVYFRVWRNASTYSPESGTAQSWLVSIARNRAIDILRQKRAVPASEVGDTDWYERIAEERDREADMIDNASLRRCLGQIDAQARSCVLLAYYEGFSREELAERFGRPVNTIKTWLHRSLASLRSCLDAAVP